jgi:hypothetical protein
MQKFLAAGTLVIGNTLVFCKLVQSPDASPSISKISFRAATSYLVGLTKIVVSSAYSEALVTFDLGEIWFSTPLPTARCSNLWRGSIAKINSMGEIGSPCLRPRSCLIGQPRVPFRRIREDEVDKAMSIQFRHLVPNPNFSKTSSMYTHEMESRAFAMSNLRNMAGIFFLCNSFAML